ncbi:MAG: hypothetical protein ACE5G8_05260 [Anaerolineae bacterium]
MTIDFEQPDDSEVGGGNRVFVILAVGLAGLIVLGLVAIGGVLILRNIRNQQAIAQVTPPPTPTLSVTEEVPTATATHTPIPPLPTEVPSATPTNTPVVLPTNTPTQDEAATATAEAPPPTNTNTPVPVGTPAGGGEVPDTGVGGFGLALVAVGLAGVLAVSRRLRRAT